jgi:hypothetical protein
MTDEDALWNRNRVFEMMVTSNAQRWQVTAEGDDKMEHHPKGNGPRGS